MEKNAEDFIKLIKDNKLALDADSYDDLDSKTKDEIVKYLDSENYQTGAANYPKDILDVNFTIADFGKNSKLLVFGLYYEGPEVCSGTLVFLTDQTTCKIALDTVVCSD